MPIAATTSRASFFGRPGCAQRASSISSVPGSPRRVGAALIG
jgi:hypothetical protein